MLLTQRSHSTLAVPSKITHLKLCDNGVILLSLSPLIIMALLVARRTNDREVVGSRLTKVRGYHSVDR